MERFPLKEITLFTKLDKTDKRFRDLPKHLRRNERLAFELKCVKTLFRKERNTARGVLEPAKWLEGSFQADDMRTFLAMIAELGSKSTLLNGDRWEDVTKWVGLDDKDNEEMWKAAYKADFEKGRREREKQEAAERKKWIQFAETGPDSSESSDRRRLEVNTVAETNESRLNLLLCLPILVLFYLLWRRNSSKDQRQGADLMDEVLLALDAELDL